MPTLKSSPTYHCSPRCFFSSRLGMRPAPRRDRRQAGFLPEAEGAGVLGQAIDAHP